MPIKPSPTIAGKLRKLFNNNKQTIEPAIGDNIPGGGSGGALIVTLTSSENPFKGEKPHIGMTSDKTMKEIFDASGVGPVIALCHEDGNNSSNSIPVWVSKNDDDTYIYLYSFENAHAFPLYNEYTDNGTFWLLPD